MEIIINTKELTKDISRFEESVAKSIAEGKLRDGRKYQVQITITTNEDDFIDSDELVNVYE